MGKIDKIIKWAADEPTNGIILYGCLKSVLAPVIVMIIGAIVCGIVNIFS